MAGKISEMSTASALVGSELVEVVQSGANKSVTINDLLPVQLQGNKTIDLNSNELIFSQNGNTFLEVNGAPGGEHIGLNVFDSENEFTVASSINIYSNSDDGHSIDIISTNPIDNTTYAQLHILGDDKTILLYGDGGITLESEGGVIIPDMVEKDFADDTAAAVGLVPVGGIYHTSGTLKIRLA